ncbi:MAG: Ig-like domain-containing protein [Spirochaetes bacterium]|nr:Ig-like domain-containing protein [Spirochaetota bacterium]
MRRGRPGGGLIILALLSAAFVSCADFEALEVAAWSPFHQQYGVSRDADIWLEFSADVRRSSIEESFSLRAESAKIAGQFQWETGRKFIFIPFDSLQTGGRFVMELPRSVEDSDGNTMEEDFISEFYVGDDTVKPRVIGSDPPWTEGGATGIDTGIAGIEVLFSEPMDAMTTESAFSVSPDVPGYFAWSDGGARLTYVLTSPLEYGTQYRVTVASTAEDVMGNCLEGSYTIVFITGDDFTQPQVAGAWENGSAPPPYWDTDTVNPGVSRGSLISIEFSEPMKRSSAESAFTITPSTSGCFHWSGGDRVLTFEPEDLFDSDTVYTLRIGTSAEDVHGLRLKDPHAVSFRTNAADSQHVRATFMRGSCNDGAAPCPYEDLYDGVTLNWPLMIDMGAIAEQPNAKNFYFQVTFGNDAGPAAMNLYSLLDNIIIEGAYTPHLVNVNLSSDKTIATLLFDGLVNSEDVPPELYRVTIAGGESGIQDANDNTMERDFVFEFKDRL